MESCDNPVEIAAILVRNGMFSIPPAMAGRQLLMPIDAEGWPEISRLLDEYLDLPESERADWLGRLGPEHAHLRPALQELLSRTTAGKCDILNALPVLSPTATGPALAADAHSTGALVGPYRVEGQLGHGGMGVVWLARRADGLLKRPVALKLPLISPHNSTLAERFHRERDILAQLTDPRIARLYDAGVTSSGQPYLALEYVDGVRITQYCDEHRLGVKARLRLFIEVLGAVDHAHANQVVHRDLKPSNILVNREGHVRLLDFGIAKLLTEGEAQETELTKVGGRALTPDYASPEQLEGEPVGIASDIYSLGVVLYELLTGERPFKRMPGLEAQRSDPVPPSRGIWDEATAQRRDATPKRLASDLRGDLDAIVLQALRRRPEERYSTAAAFARDIECYLEQRPIHARRETVWSRTRRMLRRNRIAASAAAAAAALVGIGIGWVGRSATTGGAFPAWSRGLTETPPTNLRTDKSKASPANPIADASEQWIYVTDQISNRVQKFDGNGNYLGEFGSAGAGHGQFDWPEGIVVDPSGSLWVTDRLNNRVQRFDSEGVQVGEFGSAGSGKGQFRVGVLGAALDTEGNIWVTDAGNHRVEKFNDGKYLGELHSGSAIGEFKWPQAVAIDSGGNIWVTDWGNNRVQKFDKTGAYQTEFGSAGTGNGHFNGAGGIAIDASGNLWIADEYNQRVQEFSSSGAYLGQIGCATGACIRGSGDGQFRDPIGVAIDVSGNIWVTDMYNYRVQKFSNSGAYLGQFGTYGTGKGQFQAPRFIAIGQRLRATTAPSLSRRPAGPTRETIYVTDNQNSRIQKFDGNGNYLGQFGSAGVGKGQFDWPEGIVRDTQGNFWITDRNNKRVQKFDHDGRYLGQFGSPGSGDGQFGPITGNGPIGIALEAEGNIWVADAGNFRVQKFDSTGKYLGKFGSRGTGDGQFFQPEGITIDPSGNIWVTDYRQKRVQKFNRNGEYLSQIRAGTDQADFAYPEGILADRSGNIWIVDGGSHRLKKFSADGVYLGQVGTGWGSSSGQMRSPIGVAMDSAGNIWVADQDNNRIQEFSSAGEYLGQFGTSGGGKGQFNGPRFIAIAEE